MAETQQKDFFIEAIEKGYSPFMLKDDLESLSKNPEGEWKHRQSEAPSIKDFTKDNRIQ